LYFVYVTDDSLPVVDDPLDLNAPYDPEKEALKDVAKPKKGN